MKSFSEFISEASIRQGLPHITTMDHKQFGHLIHDGKVHAHTATEKTDGMTHIMGHDEHGFYTQSSGSSSERMRKAADYEHRAKRRAKETGNEYNDTAPKAFGHIHKMLEKNKAVRDHLKQHHEKTGEDVKIRGEVFYKPLAKPGHMPGEVKFVGTSYNPKHMGEHGKYVIHSKLPENHHVDTEKFKKHSTHELNFDDDKIAHQPGHVDVSAEHKQFKTLDHNLIGSRTTKTNKEAKTAELFKMSKLQHSVSKKVDAHFKKQELRPKWGSGSEGIVVHPSEHNKDAPRFKVTSDNFRAYRADPNRKSFKS